MPAHFPGGRPLVGSTVRLDPMAAADAAGPVRRAGRPAGLRRRLRRRAGRTACRPGRDGGFGRRRHRRRSGGAAPYTVRLLRRRAAGAAGTIVGTSTLGDVSLPDERVHLGWTAYSPDRVGDRGQPGMQVVAALARVRRLRLRPGEDPDRQPEHPLAGRDRPARRGPGGGAAPASGAGRRVVPGHRGVLDPAATSGRRCGPGWCSAGSSGRDAPTRCAGRAVDPTGRSEQVERVDPDPHAAAFLAGRPAAATACSAAAQRLSLGLRRPDQRPQADLRRILFVVRPGRRRARSGPAATGRRVPAAVPRVGRDRRAATGPSTSPSAGSASRSSAPSTAASSPSIEAIATAGGNPSSRRAASSAAAWPGRDPSGSAPAPRGSTRRRRRPPGHRPTPAGPAPPPPSTGAGSPRPPAGPGGPSIAEPSSSSAAPYRSAANGSAPGVAIDHRRCVRRRSPGPSGPTS